MTLPTRRFVEVVCDNPRHENWDDHEWQTDDCIVQVTEPLMSRAEWEATIDYEAAVREGKSQVGSIEDIDVNAIVDAALGIGETP